MSSTPEDFKIVWGKPEVIAPAVLNLNDLNVTAEEGNFPATLLFDTVRIDLQGAETALNATCIATVRLPVTLSKDPPAVWFKSDLRVAVSKAVGARILLIADLNGETFVKDFPDDQDVMGEGAGREFTYEFVHRAKSLPVRDYTVTLFLAVARREAKATAVITVESLEIVINPDLSDLNR